MCAETIVIFYQNRYYDKQNILELKRVPIFGPKCLVIKKQLLFLAFGIFTRSFG